MDLAGLGKLGKVKTAPTAGTLEAPPAEHLEATLRAASLAGLAESAVWFYPATVVANELAPGSSGPLSVYPLFVVAFAGGVALATAFRESAKTPTVAAAAGALAGIVQAGWWTASDPVSLWAAAAMTVVGIALAFRVIALSRRDWRNPIDASFGWGTVALLIQVIAARSTAVRIDALFIVLVPQFFLASLASRAASVRLAAGPVERHGGTGAGSWRLARRPLAALAAILGLGLLLGGSERVLERVGGLLSPVFSGLVFLMVQAARPLLWLGDKLKVNTEGVRRTLDRLRVGEEGEAPPWKVSPPGFVLRVLGLLLLVAVAALLIRWIRRYRYRAVSQDREPEAEAVDARLQPAPAVIVPGGRPGRRRRPLPAQLVRRWYAEALLALEAKGFTRDPSLTPSEYLSEVREAMPEGTEGFMALTRAYEDVRYGRLLVDRGRMDRLRRDVDGFMAVVRRHRPSDHADQPVGSEGDR